MVFHSSNHSLKSQILRSFQINNHTVECVNVIKYLGYILVSDLSNNEDINRVKRKFFIEFNSILRKFSICEAKVKLFLFKQYCLQFYGGELWFGSDKAKVVFKQFEVGYHKAVKKLLNLSMHESNHYACQESNLLTFKHLLNKMKIDAAVRFMLKPCNFIKNLAHFLKISSVMIKEVTGVLNNTYDIDSLFDNDTDAILSRIRFVQNSEQQMRLAW